MAENTKISQLEKINAFTGEEIVPLVANKVNKSALLASLKEYFRDSTLVVFDEIDDTDAEPINNSSGEEEGATYAIVYLSRKKKFVNRRSKPDTINYYFTEFSGKEDYMIDGSVRTDKVFFCLANKSQYTWDGNGLFDPYTPIVLTQEEFDALETKDENRTYYIYEEE